MKYNLASILIVTLSMHYSCSEVSESNSAKMINFKEIKILVAEYSATAKDNNRWMTTVSEEKARRGEVKLSVAIN